MQNQPTPTVDMGDLSWVPAMFDWLGSRGILPQWVVSILKIVLSVFVPNSRGQRANPQDLEKVKSLEQAFNKWQVDQGLIPGTTGTMQGPRQER